MDQYNYYNQMKNASYNRVYINRNFNKSSIKIPPKSFTCSNSNNMYLNPNFAHKSDLQQNFPMDHAIRPKIYVNPNFIRPKLQNVSITENSQINTLVTVPKVSTVYNQVIQSNVQLINNNIKQMPTVSKSRYCLVRQKEVLKPPLVKPPLNNKISQQTVKLNKYKLNKSLNSVKKSLISEKTSIKEIQLAQTKLSQTNVIKSKYSITVKSSSNNIQNTRFKYTKKNSTLVKPLDTQNRRVSITQGRGVVKMSFRQSKKLVMRAMKKNNIPCPLFKKYGKCLRMDQGGCDFLHDKKHVSICRKFLKGACHDKMCPLSHDLTDKKMPTCYFYLQGICTKAECPYLHVKLNDKAKICADFLKGYCEKGDKCALRHVNVTPKNNSKHVKTRKHSPSYTFHNDRTIIHKNYKTNNTISKVVTKNLSNVREPDMDQRYFKNASDDTYIEEQCNVIKPTRCKLGTLPSFIQL